MPDYNRLQNCLPIKKNLPWLHKQFTQKDKVGIYSILTILFLLKLLQFFCSLWAEDRSLMTLLSHWMNQLWSCPPLDRSLSSSGFMSWTSRWWAVLLGVAPTTNSFFPLKKKKANFLPRLTKFGFFLPLLLYFLSLTSLQSHWPSWLFQTYSALLYFTAFTLLISCLEYSSSTSLHGLLLISHFSVQRSLFQRDDLYPLF